MRSLLSFCSCAIIFALPADAGAQTVDEIFDRMSGKEVAGLQGIDSLLLRTETMGMSQLEFFEKTAAVDVNGETMYVLNRVPPQEISRRQSPSNALSDASPAELRAAAAALEEQGGRMEAELQREMAQTGLPGGLGAMLMNPPADQPWLSANPNDMMGMYATMLRAGADAKEADAAVDPGADQRDRVNDMALLAARTQLMGRTTIDGRPAHHLAASDLNQTQIVDGQEFTLNTLNLWVDSELYVPLRMQIEGVARQGNQSRPITIEREDKDYRAVPGCGVLYEPFQTVMRIAGVMTPEQEAQMRDAQAQMAQMEEQMRQMPAAQRQMIMDRMGPQMQMMRSMASGGGIAIESRVVDMRCNAPLPSVMEVAQAFGLGGMTGATSAAGVFDVQAPAAAGLTGEPDALKAAQQACLQERVEAAEAAQSRRRGVGRLLNAARTAASRMGNNDLANTVGDIYAADAVAQDLSAAARDLGLTEDDVAACRNP